MTLAAAGTPLQPAQGPVSPSDFLASPGVKTRCAPHLSLPLLKAAKLLVMACRWDTSEPAGHMHKHGRYCLLSCTILLALAALLQEIGMHEAWRREAPAPGTMQQPEGRPRR